MSWSLLTTKALFQARQFLLFLFWPQYSPGIICGRHFLLVNVYVKILNFANKLFVFIKQIRLLTTQIVISRTFYLVFRYQELFVLLQVYEDCLLYLVLTQFYLQVNMKLSQWFLSHELSELILPAFESLDARTTFSPRSFFLDTNIWRFLNYATLVHSDLQMLLKTFQFFEWSGYSQTIQIY